ncbi:hypothetical protein DITRI_Ditri14bG0015100 [Diplodiscus trichospermus]
MAPTIKRGETSRKASKPRRIHIKKKLVKPKGSIQKTSSVLLEDHLPSNSSTISSDHNFSKMDGYDIGVDDDDISTTSPCSTPKAQRFRIPAMDTCPPAPKKQRVVSNCPLQRTPIAFFAPPDIELFFFFAHRDISVCR